jgi:hypothetical protein
VAILLPVPPWHAPPPRAESRWRSSPTCSAVHQGRWRKRAGLLTTAEDGAACHRHLPLPLMSLVEEGLETPCASTVAVGPEVLIVVTVRAEVGGGRAPRSAV